MFEVAVNRALLIEVFDDGRIFAGELLETIFASRVGQAASIEDESSPITGFIDWHLVMERETVDANGELVRAGCDVHQLL